MIVTCENCNSSFNLKDSLVKPNGRKVRCSKCKHVFFVAPPPDETDETSSEALLRGSDSNDQEQNINKGAAQSSTSGPTPTGQEHQADESDGYDFSEVEKLLNADQSDGSRESDDLKFEMDIDVPSVSEKTQASATDGHDLDDLKLELDEPDVSQNAASDFDLSDIDELLEIDSQDASSKDDDTADFELELDLDTGNLSQNATEETANDSVAQDDFDFSKIEAMLELEDEVPSQDSREELELDFDLDDDETPTKASSTKDEEIDLDFDIEIEEDEQTFQAGKHIEDEAIENIIQASIEESGETPKPATLSRQQPSFDTFKDPAPETNKAFAVPPAASPPKGRKLVPALIVLMIIALGGGYFAFTRIAPENGNKAQATAKDDQSNKIIPLDQSINWKYVNNVHSGNLLVITGMVHNASSIPQSFIKVTGTLVTKDGGNQGIPKTVYCGNVLSDIELANANIAELNQRLLKRAGDNLANTKIAPDGKIPFMIVFSNLPDDLETFTVKVSDYVPVKSQK